MKSNTLVLIVNEIPSKEFHYMHTLRQGFSIRGDYMAKEGYKKRYYEKHKDAILERTKKYYEDHKKEKCENAKKYQQFHKEERKEYRKTHKEECKEYNKEYYRLHREKIIIHMGEYVKRRWEEDPLYRFRKGLSNRTRQAFANMRINKPTKTELLLGADYKTVMAHIGSLFTFGMSWENRELWEIDHIIPLSSAKTEKQLIKLCHYKNLQPLWAIQNREKHTKINYTTEKL